MKERYKVLIVMAMLSLGLWFGISRFMSGTQEFADGLTINDVAYLDPESTAVGALSAPQVAIDESLDGDETAPARDGTGSLTRDSAVLIAELEAVDAETSEQDRQEDVDDESLTDSQRADSDADIAAQRAAERKIEIVTSADERKLVATLNEIDEDLLGDTPATRAIDLRLPFDTLAACALASAAPFRTGVNFRYGSSAIKGASLNRIDAFLRLWKRCGGGALLIESNPQGEVDGDGELDEWRRDEVRYYLLQRRVPKEAIEQVSRS